MNNKLMVLALQQAQEAQELGEVPVGAVLVDGQGAILSQSHNLTIQQADPTAHAEINVIREACQKMGSQRLEGISLYVTLEPCPMCATAISFARIQTLYYGAFDPKGGGVDHGPFVYDQSTCHHKPQVFGGVMAPECGALLTDFFKGCRE